MGLEGFPLRGCDFAFSIPILVKAQNESDLSETVFTVSPFILGIIFFIMGLIFIIVEVSEPGFFIGIPGTILIILGVVMIYFPWIMATIWGPIVFIILGVSITAGVFWMYRYISHPERQSEATTTRVNLIGRKGKVTRKVVPDELKGKVKIESQIWSATADMEIEEGAKVKVIDAEGVHVVVEKMEDESL